ncbi:hypothetical protein LDL08_44480 [Nonomuraea glycinis]|uniref:Uncharacterized protein n=1 Tax=Nonomuraea glycinis TaxID=2047744 RepID=A0A918AFT4_9ACTN|nr:hypothetical protein [Nonomuraea glycinis]MCA2183236.1 hypothetical protein [Nonomuraea glycinis]GGP18217.1 hypothetical protein GCM10012278_89640 [Nonomuraea glycinis]
MVSNDDFRPPQPMESGLAENTVYSGPPPASPLAAAIEKVARAWLTEPGVQGVSHTANADGEDFIKIMLLDVATRARLESQLPGQVDGFPVVVEVSGEYHAQ